MRPLSGVNKNKEEGIAGPKDAYSELAPDPIAPATDAKENPDWFAEFPDESKAQAQTSAHWRALGQSLKDEPR
jgi:hypothetical protein